MLILWELVLGVSSGHLKDTYGYIFDALKDYRNLKPNCSNIFATIIGSKIQQSLNNLTKNNKVGRNFYIFNSFKH